MKKVLALVLALSMMLGMTSALAETTIEFWTVFTGDDGATLQGLINQFNEEHAGTIKVNHTAIAAADLYTKLPLAVQTGEGIPDLMIGHVERLPKLAGDGVLTDVEYLLENGVDAANYPANVLERTKSTAISTAFRGTSTLAFCTSTWTCWPSTAWNPCWTTSM